MLSPPREYPRGAIYVCDALKSRIFLEERYHSLLLLGFLLHRMAPVRGNRLGPVGEERRIGEDAAVSIGIVGSVSSIFSGFWEVCSLWDKGATIE